MTRQGGPVNWGGAPSRLFAEPKRLARLGYLRTSSAPGRSTRYLRLSHAYARELLSLTASGSGISSVNSPVDPGAVRLSLSIVEVAVPLKLTDDLLLARRERLQPSAQRPQLRVGLALAPFDGH